jgi:hypothetical protein
MNGRMTVKINVRIRVCKNRCWNGTVKMGKRIRLCKDRREKTVMRLYKGE